MTDQPGLFDVADPDPDRHGQGCSVRTCTTAAYASDDALRARGWLVFDGESVTGQPLHVRVCPGCQRKFRKATARLDPDRLPSWAQPLLFPLEPEAAPSA